MMETGTTPLDSPGEILQKATDLRKSALHSVKNAAERLEAVKRGVGAAKEDLKAAINASAQLGIDVPEIAKAAGVSSSTVSAWTRKPKVHDGKDD